MTYQSVQEYEGLDVEIGAPYGRFWCRERKAWFRIETDGRGGTREYPEQGDPPTMLGLNIETTVRMRKRFRRMDAKKENSDWREDRIQREAIRVLNEHGPMTKNELADILRVWVYQVNHALTDLKKRGKATCYRHAEAKGRKYLWRSCVPHS